MNSQPREHLFVTGAASGIGLCFAKEVVDRGGFCTLLDADREALEKLQLGPLATTVWGDASEPEDVEGALKKSAEIHGPFTGFFNNAGVLGSRNKIHEASSEDYTQILDVNLKSVWVCMKSEVGHCLASSPCAIVNNASVSGLRGSANYPLYAAAKHGVVGLTRSAALSYGELGIRVNAVASSVVRTNMTRREREQYGGSDEEDGRSNPLGRVASPEDVANAALWLLSEKATHITGHVLQIDGGQNA